MNFLVDANLPSKVPKWEFDNFKFVTDINPNLTDNEIWQLAKKQNLVILSKDSDFTHRILSSVPPPRVVHFKTGNMKLSKFKEFVQNCWDDISKQVEHCKLINVFDDHIEGIK